MKSSSGGGRFAAVRFWAASGREMSSKTRAEPGRARPGRRGVRLVRAKRERSGAWSPARIVRRGAVAGAYCRL